MEGKSESPKQDSMDIKIDIARHFAFYEYINVFSFSFKNIHILSLTNQSIM